MQHHAIRRIGLAMPLAIGLLTAIAAPVAGRPFERLGSSEDVSGVEEVCGESWVVSGHSREVVTLKAGRHGDPTPYFSYNHHSRITYTDAQDASRGFLISSNGIFKDVHVDLIEGTTYAFTSIDVGHTAISSLEGRTIAVDSGRVLWTFIVDTQGSSDLDQYVLLDAIVEAISGPHATHPGDDKFCAAVAEAAG